MRSNTVTVPKRKKRSRVSRADSSDDDNGLLEARTSRLSADRRRLRTSIPQAVARVDDGPSLKVVPPPSQPDMVAIPLLPKKQRRYKNSVSLLHGARLRDTTYFTSRTKLSSAGCKKADPKNTWMNSSI